MGKQIVAKYAGLKIESGQGCSERIACLLRSVVSATAEESQQFEVVLKDKVNAVDVRPALCFVRPMRNVGEMH